MSILNMSILTNETKRGHDMKNPLDSLQNTILLGIAITIVMALIVRYSY